MGRSFEEPASHAIPDAAGATPFRLRMLGGFELTDGTGAAIVLPTRKCRLLLAYLAAPPGQMRRRGRLAGLLWPRNAEEQARASLRKALSAIRSSLGDHAIFGDRETVGLTDGLLDIDLAHLERLGSESRAHWDIDELHRLSQPFLDGIDADGEELSDWLNFERSRCQSLSQKALTLAARNLSDAGAEADATAIARRLVALDPMREQGHRVLMRVLTRQGERSLALEQYRRCRKILRDELGVEPSAETTDLAKSIARDNGEEQETFLPKTATSGEHGNKYSIAVMPFANASDCVEQRFFAEGLAEDIITELSRHKDLVVISRQSSFAFGPDADTADAARRLNIRYVLTGTVRRTGGRMRVGVQLVDTIAQASVWAQRYDRETGDIFDVQEEIAREVVIALDSELRLAERTRAARVRPDNLDAWELFNRGLWHAYNFSPDDWQLAEGFFRQSVDADPAFALPHAGLGYLELLKANWHYTDDPDAAVRNGLDHAKTAVGLDSTNPFVQVVLGRLLTVAGEIDAALEHLMFAEAQNPNYAHVHYALAIARFWAGKPAESLESSVLAARLSPREPLTSMFHTLSAFSLFWLGDLPAAERHARRGMQLQPRETWSRLALAATLWELGDSTGAAAAVAEARRIDPKLSIESFFAVVRHTPQPIRDRIDTALAAAGLPE